MSDTENFIPYHPTTYNESEMCERSKKWYQFFDKRRSVRRFSDKKFPIEIIENAILSASTAPSGAHINTAAGYSCRSPYDLIEHRF
jgi:iodotyrosine deiodinase